MLLVANFFLLTFINRACLGIDAVAEVEIMFKLMIEFGEKRERSRVEVLN